MIDAIVREEFRQSSAAVVDYLLAQMWSENDR